MNAKLFMDAVGQISGDTIARYSGLCPAVSSESKQRRTDTAKNLIKWLAAAAALIALGFGIFAVIKSFSGIDSGRPHGGDYPYYASVEELMEASDAVIVGEVISAGEERSMSVSPDSAEKLTYTVSKIRVTEAVKGRLRTGDVIEVKQLGSEKVHYAESGSYLKKGSTQLLFLEAYDGMPYSPVSPYQGAAEVRDGRLYAFSSSALFGYDEHEPIGKVIDELREYPAAIDYPSAIMVNGTLYYSTDEALPVEIDESAIRYTTSYAEDGVPRSDGEANFDRDTGTPYAVIDSGTVVVLIDNEWIAFRP